MADDTLSVEASAFEMLEKDFQEVLSSVVGDKSLDKFKVEYEKLHVALKKSYDNEKRLVKKVRELNSEIVSNAAKVASALKLSEDDDETIDSLKKQIEKAWTMVEASHEKELKANETIQRLKGEIANLTRLVEKHTGLSGHDDTLDELLKVRDVLTRRNEDAAATIQRMQADLDELHSRVDHKRQKNRDKKVVIADLKDQVKAKDSEQDRELKKKERVERELKDLKTQLETRAKAAVDLTVSIKDGEAKNLKLETQLAAARKEMERYLRDFDGLYQNTEQLQEKLNEANRRTDTLTSQKIELEKDLQTRQDQLNRTSAELGRCQRHLESEKKTVLRLNDKIGEEKLVQNQLKAEINALNMELGTEIKHVTEAKKMITTLERDRTMEQQKRMKESDKLKEEHEKVESGDRSIRHLENKINRYREEAVKTRNVIYHLEKDREKYGIQLAETQAKLAQSLEDLKLKESQMQELEKKETEVRARLKHQQQMYEGVRADRNTYSKHLIEAQDEIAEMKRKFKIMNHQIEQLKEEITAKDRALVSEHFDHEGAKKLKEQKEREVERLRKLLKQQDDVVAKQAAEILELNSTIHRMDSNSLQQRQEYDQVVTERDILGTQLIRRNDELALLYEKVKIMESTLKKGEAQYLDRVQDMRILKLKIGDLKRELAIQKSKSGEITELRREVYRLQKELLQEKTKVKALSEELENPMNVHRWRKLEGSDPATYEMIQKIQTLQKRLIAKTEEAVEKELLIQEKEKLYVELKNILARQPGPEVAEQLSVYQQNLKEKTRQMKAMASELNMYQAQINEYKYEIERLSRELQEVKRKFYETKRRTALAEQRAFESTVPPGAGRGEATFLDATPSGGRPPAPAARIAAAQQIAAHESKPRFTGGGFNIQPGM